MHFFVWFIESGLLNYTHSLLFPTFTTLLHHLLKFTDHYITLKNNSTAHHHLLFINHHFFHVSSFRASHFKINHCSHISSSWITTCLFAICNYNYVETVYRRCVIISGTTYFFFFIITIAALIAKSLRSGWCARFEMVCGNEIDGKAL